MKLARPRISSGNRGCGAPSFRGPEKIRTKAAVCLLLLFAPALRAETTAQAALSSALRATGAVGVVVDVNTGRLVAAVNSTDAARQPGSILKPLFLAAALEQHLVLPQATVFCRRDLRISTGSREWNLACTHPQSDVPFAAQEALAYSCNRYFAALADRMSPAQVSATLEHYGLGHIPTPQTREQKELLVLGVAGIAVSPTQIASAYRKLALELDDPRAPTVLDPVREGLRDSVRYGMAHNAAIPGIEIAGKTGTANDGGWFAGVGSFAQEQIVLVVYLPRGNGADAARLAQRFFLPPPTPESARSLTIELWAARSVTQLTATPLNTAAPIKVEWSQDGLRTSPGRAIKRIALSGGFRMQAAGAQDVVAAGSWAITLAA